MSEIRKLAEDNPEARPALMDAVEPVKLLLTKIIQRLHLKDKEFSVGTPVTPYILMTYGNVCNSLTLTSSCSIY